MRPRIARLEGKTPCETPFQGYAQGVVGACSDISLDINRTKRISARIILVQRPDAIALIAIESDWSAAQVHPAARKEPDAPAPKILSRKQEIGRQGVFDG